VHDKDRNAAIEAGMNAFTEKPISAEKLFEIMDQHLQGQK
jgi:CheY-like chemotaxis protein